MTTTAKRRAFKVNPASPKVLAAFRKTGGSVDDEEAVQEFLAKHYGAAVRRDTAVYGADGADACETWIWITDTFLAAMKAQS